MINDILAVVCLIVIIQNGTPVGTATGFFYAKNDTVYLVTNRHVVSDEAKGMKPESLRVRLHQNATDISKNRDFDIPLYAKNKKLWHVHPSYDKSKIDIAVIEVDQQALRSGHYFQSLSHENFLPKQFVIRPGEDVMVLGFPRGFSDPVHNLPLARNAMIASAYPVHFALSPFFMIDANLHQGMSGSPVITKPKNEWVDEKGNVSLITGTPMFFLGIFSAIFNFNISSGLEPAGLGQVWYGYLIEEILDSIK